MNTTAVTRLTMSAILIMTAGSAFAQELQLNCPLDWSALGDIDGPDQHKIIYGLPAKDWKKAHVDAMLAKEQECSQNSTDAASMNEMRAEAVSSQLYPNALASLRRRDERVMQAQQFAERETTQQGRTADMQNDQAAQASGAGAGTSAGAASAELASAPKEEDTLQPASVDAQEPVTKEVDRAWMGWAALLAVVVAFCWQRFVRNRCTSCRSTRVERVGEREIDRWRGTKQVSERTTRGTKTRHVQTTYVKVQFDYRCAECQQAWSKVRKEELGSGSDIGRFFCGY
jgi:hypothetical protein